MKKLFFAFIFLHSVLSFSQPELNKTSSMCSYYGEKIDNVLAVEAEVTEAENIISRIIDVIGLKPRFEIRAANVPNAAAIVYGTKRYVLYNPDFISSINKATGNSWAAVSILAHEIGHHLNGHTLENSGSRPDIELEADEFSGFVLRKLGSTLLDAQAAMSVAASLKASHTHPGKQERLAAIARGWNNAGVDVAGNRENRSVEKPVVITSKIEHAALAEKYIAKDVVFVADPKGLYYITIRGNLVKIENEKLHMIGRMAESNLKGYHYMLYDNVYNYLYIDNKGKIYNGKGKRVGSMTDHR